MSSVVWGCLHYLSLRWFLWWSFLFPSQNMERSFRCQYATWLAGPCVCLRRASPYWAASSLSSPPDLNGIWVILTNSSVRFIHGVWLLRTLRGSNLEIRKWGNFGPVALELVGPSSYRFIFHFSWYTLKKKRKKTMKKAKLRPGLLLETAQKSVTIVRKCAHSWAQ